MNSIRKDWRTYIVFLFLFIFGAAIVGRLVFVQIINYGFYKALAQGQQNFSSFEKGDRGEIFVQDKHGTLYTLATNQELSFVFVTPPEVENYTETAKQLSEILGVDTHVIAEKLQHKESLHEPIKRRISEEEEEKIVSADMPGVYIGKDFARYYPYEDLASHVVGFTNQDGNGQYGIEEYHNNLLEGKEGLRTTARNPASYLFLALEDTTLETGSDIVLTLDFNLQIEAEKQLQEAKENLNIEEGTIIVLEIKTGRILTLANTPSFNSNEYFLYDDLAVFQNSAIQKLFEPGSVFKAITMASAIDAGKVTPDTTYLDNGMVKIGGYTIYNYDERVWGQRTMSEVLQFSINTGAVFAEQQLGHNRFLDYIKKFGIFKPTEIGLAGEIYSENREFQKGYEINFATAAFGQGIEMTPLQLVRAFSALANKGTLVEPFLVERIVDAKGLLQKPKRKAAQQVISPNTASDITAMLVSVTEDGFAKSARIPGYYVAGKTGTSQISWSALGISKAGYSDKTIQSFIGYIPAFDPKFLILVKLDNPATKTAEYSAIPIFRNFTKYIVDYYQIPPDYEINP